ncbi:MAG: hypothetical protein WCF36_09990 [Candidatus Nanopelagicales bacterium]
MLGFFESKPFRDQQLGTFDRRHGKWIGSITLPPHGQVELRVAGDRAGPDAASLLLAAHASAQFSAVRAELACQLLEHYLPYQDAWQRNDLENQGVALSVPEEVWAHVLVASIDVDARRVDSPIEFRLDVGWDQEHTLGAFVRDGRLVELNGSVIR